MLQNLRLQPSDMQKPFDQTMVKVGDTISSPTNDYLVKVILGSGSFGTVVLCEKKCSKKLVALKIIKNERAMAASKDETEILCMMRIMGSQDFNIVKWIDSFMAGDHFCIEFEKLDLSIFDYMSKNSLSLKEIRPIIQQLAVALEFLKMNEVIHADLKPENVMMVDSLLEPLRVKLIDFGLAHLMPRPGHVCGSRYYMAPEMLLGAPYSTAIDTWALGCIAVEMLTGKVLFPGKDEVEMLRLIISLLGNIPHEVIRDGYHTRKYFFKAFTPDLRFFSWYLKMNRDANWPPNAMKSLQELLVVADGATLQDYVSEMRDRTTFYDLIVQMLHVDPEKRITPSDILKHPFLTLSHLDRDDDASYLQESIQFMKVCPGWRTDEEKDAPLCSPCPF